MTKDRLPPYFEKYFDNIVEETNKRFDSLEEVVKELKDILLKKNGILEKIQVHLIETKDYPQILEKNDKRLEKIEKWIDGFEARIGVVVTILGSVFALMFTLVKDAVVNLLRIK